MPACAGIGLFIPAANAETVLRSVAPSLEESINGVENMSYMSSTASNDGTLAITVYFKQGTNPDQAAVNVQNRAASGLPASCPLEGCAAGYNRFTNAAKQPDRALIGMYTEDAKKYDQAFVAKLCADQYHPRSGKRIPGVGSATMIFGGIKDYSMRVWLNPGQMAAYKITPCRCYEQPIQDKNLEAAISGKFGERRQGDL